MYFFPVPSTMGTHAQGLLWHHKFSPQACEHLAHTCSPHSIIDRSKNHDNEGNNAAVNSSFTLKAHLYLLFTIFSNWKRPSTKEKNGKTMIEKYKPIFLKYIAFMFGPNSFFEK